MEFLIIWLSTVAVSFGMEIANELRMFKDVADAGYRVDVNRLSELGKQLNPNSVNITLLSLLMPVVNIMYVFQRAIQYNNVRPMILDQLNVIDVLKEMTELEKIEYLEKPTGLNAAFVTLKSEIPYLNPLLYGSSIEINRDDEHSKIYYKTDHHWTTLGAFYAFQAAAPSLGIDGDLSGKYVSYTVSDSFNGMLASKSGVNLGEKEQIDIYVPTEEDTDLIVDYVDEGKRSTSLYDSSKLKEKDQYTVFLGGNSSLLDIRTVSTSTKRLLLVKDSFANSFIPFLTPYYREIVVVDPRYYSGTINDLMDSYRISEVLFLYSGNTFFKDNNISGVFAVE